MNEEFKAEWHLAEVLCSWLEEDGWETFKEVHCRGGEIDVVALREDVLWAIECKMTFSADVCQQASERLPFAHYVSVAVPHRKTHNAVNTFFLKHHGIGKLEISLPGPYRKIGNCVREDIRPRLVRISPERSPERAKRLAELRSNLTKYNKEAVAGKQYGKQVTPFKVTMRSVEEFLVAKGRATLKEIVEGIRHHYTTTAGAKQGIVTAMRKYPEWRDLFESEKAGKTEYWSIRRRARVRA